MIIISKVHTKNQGYDKTIHSTKQSATYFEYIDVMLIHWPGVQGMKSDNIQIKEIRSKTWKALENLFEEGIVREIGISNYNTSHLEELLSTCLIKPHLLQNEYHPRYQQTEVRELCAKHNIKFMGYSPLGQGHLLTNPSVAQIAVKLRLTSAQVLIKWGLQKGAIVIPRSSNPLRIQENVKSWTDDVTLDADDMRILNMLNDGHKFCWDPKNVI